MKICLSAISKVTIAILACTIIPTVCQGQVFFDYTETQPVFPGVGVIARLELTEVPATNASQVVSLEFTEEATQAMGLGEGKYIIKGINGLFSNGCGYGNFATCRPGLPSSALSVSPEGLLEARPGFLIIIGTDAPPIPGFGSSPQLYIDIGTGNTELTIFQPSAARPSFPGSAVRFSLLGNFTLVTEPSSAGDFDGDGEVNGDDVNLFIGNLDQPATGDLAQLDLDGDGDVTIADHNLLVTTLVMTSNGVTGALLGDINLDGTVDVLNDAFILVGSLGQSVTSRAQGDLNADGGGRPSLATRSFWSANWGNQPIRRKSDRTKRVQPPRHPLLHVHDTRRDAGQPSKPFDGQTQRSFVKMILPNFKRHECSNENLFQAQSAR